MKCLVFVYTGMVDLVLGCVEWIYVGELEDLFCEFCWNDSSKHWIWPRDAVKCGNHGRCCHEHGVLMVDLSNVCFKIVCVTWKCYGSRCNRMIHAEIPSSWYDRSWCFTAMSYEYVHLLPMYLDLLNISKARRVLILDLVVMFVHVTHLIQIHMSSVWWHCPSDLFFPDLWNKYSTHVW